MVHGVLSTLNIASLVVMTFRGAFEAQPWQFITPSPLIYSGTTLIQGTVIVTHTCVRSQRALLRFNQAALTKTLSFWILEIQTVRIIKNSVMHIDSQLRFPSDVFFFFSFECLRPTPPPPMTPPLYLTLNGTGDKASLSCRLKSKAHDHFEEK